MTPAARLQAAIEVLDACLAGRAAEQALTNWARASRFAGSGDRAAVRDLVFDALRCQRSFAQAGGGLTGRGLILGGLVCGGADIAALFTGIGHAPAPLCDQEFAHLSADRRDTWSQAVALDCPDWLMPDLKTSLDGNFAQVMGLLQTRAPVFLRVNTARISRPAAQELLADQGIECQVHALAPTALEITQGAKKLRSSQAFAEGLIELQDVASQAVCAAISLGQGARALDYCAGGGGKALALAASSAALGVQIFAHDADPRRMHDIAARAARAGVKIAQLATADLAHAAPFDLVLADVPCSGSGSWRRAPEAKWRLTPARLAELLAIQSQILVDAAQLVGPQGRLVYVTCSLLHAENADQISAFCTRYSDWQLEHARRLTPLDGGDGFYVAVLKRRG